MNFSIIHHEVEGQQWVWKKRLIGLTREADYSLPRRSWRQCRMPFPSPPLTPTTTSSCIRGVEPPVLPQTGHSLPHGRLHKQGILGGRSSGASMGATNTWLREGAARCGARALLVGVAFSRSVRHNGGVVEPDLGSSGLTARQGSTCRRNGDA